MSKCAITKLSFPSHCSGPLAAARAPSTTAQDSIPYDDNSYLVARALKYCADRFDIASIVGFFSRRFQDGGLVAQLGARRQRTKTVEANVAFADVMVAIPV